MKKPPRFLGWLNEIILLFVILLHSGQIEHMLHLLQIVKTLQHHRHRLNYN